MKKLKGLCLTLIIVILSIAMTMGTLAMSAFALTLAPGEIIGTTATPTQFYSTFNYGEKDIDVTGVTKVTAPNGREIKPVANKITADQIGAYTLTYKDYSYNVKCVMDKDYELRVDYAGAEIPTYMATEGTLRIPAAYLWYKNEDGEFLKDTTITVKSIVEGVSGEVEQAATKLRTVKVKSLGTITVHYFAKIKDGTKYISQDFVVKVQSTFKDETKPSLNVVNVPKEISLKTKVTLPIATATDNYDANVKIAVTVDQFDKTSNKFVPVKYVKADDNGYGIDPATDAPAVVFDNKNTMSFFPMQPVKYRITYTAIDDTLDAEGKEIGKSTSQEFSAEAIDKTAPILKSIEDNQIPTKWGKASITRYDENEDGNKKVVTDTKITFPFPKYIDNTANAADLSVSFEIYDTINKQTVIKFNNIYDTKGDGAKYKKDVNGKFPSDMTFDKTGLVLNLAEYCNKIANETTPLTYTGDYTVTYQARDNAPNISTKTYTINLAETFTDIDKPIGKVNFDDKYIVVPSKTNVDGTEFKVPVLTTSDESATMLKIDYKLTNGTESIKVKGGELAKLGMFKDKGDVSEKPYLKVKNSFKVAATDEEYKYLDLTVGKLMYDISVKDNVGNVFTKTNDGVGENAKPIKVLLSDSFNAWANVLSVDFTNMVDPSSKTAGHEMELGGFTLTAKTGMRDFVGFEMTLTNEKKEIISTNIEFETFFKQDSSKDNSGVNTIDKIKFIPQTSGTYTLYIRIFDVTGRSTVKSFTYVVTANPDENPDKISGANIPLAGSVYTTYQLKNVDVEAPGHDSAKAYVVRQINAGGKFSLMGTQFTAYTQGTYFFKDGYYKTGSSDLTYFNEDSEKGYKLTVDEKGTPAWQLQGKMPTVVAKDAKVTLPLVVATANYFNAEIEVEIKSPKGILSIAENADDNAENKSKDVQIDSEGRYFFTAKFDGPYTVQYTARYGSTSLQSPTYTIKSGDVIAPSFELESIHNKRAVEKDNFEFNVVKLTSDDASLTDAQKKEYTYNKKLKDPSNAVVYEVNEKGENGRTRKIPSGKEKYVFDKTGTYTVEYQVIDAAGNSGVYSETITVTAAKVHNPFSTKVISTILIIVGVLLIAGVILYFVRFRKNKSSK